MCELFLQRGTALHNCCLGVERRWKLKVLNFRFWLNKSNEVCLAAQPDMECLAGLYFMEIPFPADYCRTLSSVGPTPSAGNGNQSPKSAGNGNHSHKGQPNIPYRVGPLTNLVGFDF